MVFRKLSVAGIPTCKTARTKGAKPVDGCDKVSRVCVSDRGARAGVYCTTRDRGYKVAREAERETSTRRIWYAGKVGNLCDGTARSSCKEAKRKRWRGMMR